MNQIKSRLVQTLEQESMTVIREEISPRGIVKIWIEPADDHRKDLNILKRLGLNAKWLPFPMKTLLGQSKEIGFRLN